MSEPRIFRPVNEVIKALNEQLKAQKCDVPLMDIPWVQIDEALLPPMTVPVIYISLGDFEQTLNFVLRWFFPKNTKIGGYKDSVVQSYWRLWEMRLAFGYGFEPDVRETFLVDLSSAAVVPSEDKLPALVALFLLAQQPEYFRQICAYREEGLPGVLIDGVQSDGCSIIATKHPKVIGAHGFAFPKRSLNEFRCITPRRAHTSLHFR